MKPTQCQQILEYMRRYGSITQIEAIRDIGCMRLAARISDLRGQGYAIDRRMKNGKNRDGEDVSFAEYYLIEEDNHEQH